MEDRKRGREEIRVTTAKIAPSTDVFNVSYLHKSNTFGRSASDERRSDLSLQILARWLQASMQQLRLCLLLHVIVLFPAVLLTVPFPRLSGEKAVRHIFDIMLE